MRIAIDAHPLDMKVKAGIYHSSLRLIKHLTRLDDENEYSIYCRKPSLPDLQGKSDNYPVRRIGCPSLHIGNVDIFLPLLWLPALVPLELYRSRPHILFCLTATLPLFHPCKTVIKVHDIAILKNKKYYSAMDRFSFAAATSFGVKHADKIIAVSGSTRNDVIDVFGISPEKISVVHDSYDSDIFRPYVKANEIISAKQRYSIDGDYIIYVGTLEPRKNVAGLLDALSLLKKAGDFPYKLVIAGKTGWLYENIFSVVRRLGLEDEVIFTGYVPDDDLPRLINGAALFVYPSLYEGFGVPIVEAMACGVPVVTSNTSSMPEVAGDAAILIDPRDTEEMAKAIATTLSDEGLRLRLIRKGLERAKLFTPEKEARGTLEVFGSLYGK